MGFLKNVAFVVIFVDCRVASSVANNLSVGGEVIFYFLPVAVTIGNGDKTTLVVVFLFLDGSAQRVPDLEEVMVGVIDKGGFVVLRIRHSDKITVGIVFVGDLIAHGVCNRSDPAGRIAHEGKAQPVGTGKSVIGEVYGHPVRIGYAGKFMPQGIGAGEAVNEVVFIRVDKGVRVPQGKIEIENFVSGKPSHVPATRGEGAAGIAYQGVGHAGRAIGGKRPQLLGFRNRFGGEFYLLVFGKFDGGGMRPVRYQGVGRN